MMNILDHNLMRIGIKEHFQTVTDQRQGEKITYCFFEVLFGSSCSVIAGAKRWLDIREYILGHHDRFKRNGLFLNDIPADDTIARIISTIEPEQFQEYFINWMSSIHMLTESQVIAIHGKTLRGSYNREDRAVQSTCSVLIPHQINSCWDS